MFRDFGNGAAQAFTYDPVLRLSQLTNNLTGTANDLTATFGNGALQGYAFDPVSRLKTLTNDLAGGANDLTVGGTTTPITYSPASQITSTPRSGDAYPYTAFTSFNRDYVSNGLNQYTSSVKAGVTTTYGYDTRGNLTSDGTSTFAYTSENLLKSGPNLSSLAYDLLTRLYQLSNPRGLMPSSYRSPGKESVFSVESLLARLR